MERLEDFLCVSCVWVSGETQLMHVGGPACCIATEDLRPLFKVEGRSPERRVDTLGRTCSSSLLMKRCFHRAAPFIYMANGVPGGVKAGRVFFSKNCRDDEHLYGAPSGECFAVLNRFTTITGGHSR